MPERLVRSYRYARGASRLGAYALYWDSGAEPAGWHRLLLPARPLGGLRALPPAQRHCGGDLLRLRPSSRRVSPALLERPVALWERQFTRLVAAAALLGLRAVFDAMVPSSHAFGSLGEIRAITHADLDLKIISVVIFLVCLAMVVRYGDALKEDSDSFVLVCSWSSQPTSWRCSVAHCHATRPRHGGEEDFFDRACQARRNFDGQPVQHQERPHPRMRFSTLEALCQVLNCKPGDLIDYLTPEENAAERTIGEIRERNNE